MLQILTVGTPSPAQRPVVLALEGREDARLSSVDTVAAAAGTAADVVVLWGTAAEQAEAAARLGAGAGAGAADGAAVPLVAALAEDDGDAAVALLAAGVTDVLRPGLTPAELAARLGLVLAVRAAAVERRRDAVLDPVTGALSRRMFLTRAAEEVERARRYSHGLSLLVIGVEGLAESSDNGDDAILGRLAATCTGVLREPDLIGRLGYDELAVLLPSTAAAGALALAERLRAALAAANEGDGPACLVCIGAAECGSDSVERLLGRAEKALLAARRQGPDHVMLAVGG